MQSPIPLHKAGLRDGFGRAHTYLRISLTDRCNLRCTYCMPETKTDWMARASLMTGTEIERLARLFVAAGIDKIRLTGGEPSLRPDLVAIVETLRAIPGLDTLALTTNGLTLGRQALPLRRAGLDSVTISLDTLRGERFLAITKRDRFDDVWTGIEAALGAGFLPLKLNVVMMRGINDDELLEFVALTRERPLHVRFIEYMPFHGTDWTEASLYPYHDMIDRIAQHYDIGPVAAKPGAVGKDYRVAGHAGAIGFVTSMSESFCGACNRLRLTANGNLKSCLFSSGEVDLLQALRHGADDDEVLDMIGAALAAKPASHPPMSEILKLDNRAMVEIGG